MALTRVPQASDTDLTVQFYVDGDPTDATGTVDVTITAINGDAIDTGTGTSTGTTGEYFYTLSAADTTDLNLYRVVWEATVSGQAQTIAEWVEVAGGFLFNLVEARSLRPLDDATANTDEQIAEARTLAETVLEDECGTAFVPRYAYETLSSRGGVHLPVSFRNLRSIRSASIDGADLTLTDLTISGESSVYYSAGWDEGWSNVIVGYEHGMDTPPPDVSRACLLLARHYLIDSPIDDRATTMTNEDGTFSLITPGVRGAVTGLPEVNATIQRYSIPDLVG